MRIVLLLLIALVVTEVDAREGLLSRLRNRDSGRSGENVETFPAGTPAATGIVCENGVCRSVNQVQVPTQMQVQVQVPTQPPIQTIQAVPVTPEASLLSAETKLALIEKSLVEARAEVERARTQIKRRVQYEAITLEAEIKRMKLEYEHGLEDLSIKLNTMIKGE